MTESVSIQPRLIRLRDAAHYLGMDKNRFNTDVRPYITEIPVGARGIGFDRLDLDSFGFARNSFEPLPPIIALHEYITNLSKTPPLFLQQKSFWAYIPIGTLTIVPVIDWRSRVLDGAPCLVWPMLQWGDGSFVYRIEPLRINRLLTWIMVHGAELSDQTVARPARITPTNKCPFSKKADNKLRTEANPDNGQVYFLQSGRSRGFIKIGHTKNLKHRFTNLSTSSPEPLELLAAHDGSREKERELHCRFAKLRVRGEWFEPQTDLLRYIFTLFDKHGWRRPK